MYMRVCARRDIDVYVCVLRDWGVCMFQAIGVCLCVCVYVEMGVCGS